MTLLQLSVCEFFLQCINLVLVMAFIYLSYDLVAETKLASVRYGRTIKQRPPRVTVSPALGPLGFQELPAVEFGFPRKEPTHEELELQKIKFQDQYPVETPVETERFIGAFKMKAQVEPVPEDYSSSVRSPMPEQSELTTSTAKLTSGYKVTSPTDQEFAKTVDPRKRERRFSCIPRRPSRTLFMSSVSEEPGLEEEEESAKPKHDWVDDTTRASQADIHQNREEDIMRETRRFRRGREKVGKVG